MGKGICAKCGTDDRYKDGRCRKCISNQGKIYRSNPDNMDRKNETRRVWRMNAEIQLREKEYRDANKERIAIRSNEWYAKNKERRLEKGREWRAKHPEHGKIQYAKNREKELERGRKKWPEYNKRRYPFLRERKIARITARKRSIKAPDPETIRAAEMIKKMPCGYCGGPGGTVDHIMPISRGGIHHWTNMFPACVSCNSSKGSKKPEEWLASRSTRG